MNASINHWARWELHESLGVDTADTINWVPGDDVIVHPGVKNEEAKTLFPDFKIVKPYLRTTPLPKEKDHCRMNASINHWARWELHESLGVDTADTINWVPGDDVIVHPGVKNEEAKTLFPDFKIVKPYLRTTPLPKEKTTAA